VVLALAAFAWFGWHIYNSGFEWGKFQRSFSEIDPLWFSAGLFTSLLTYPGRALRWRLLMRPVCAKPRFGNLVRATLIGFTAIVLLGRPAEMIRPYLIAIREKVPFSSQVAAWLLERVYDLLLVLIIFGYALTVVNPDLGKLSEGLRWVLRAGGSIVILTTFLCLVFLLGMRWFSGALEQRLLDSLAFLPPAYLGKIEQLIRAFSAGVRSTRSGSFTAQILGYTVLEWIIIFGCNYFLFQSFPSTRHLSANDTLVYLSFVAFGSTVQIPGVGGGMQVASVLVLTELFGVGLEEATGVSVLIWLATYVVVVPIGIVVALREGLNWHKLKSLEAEAEAGEPASSGPAAGMAD
jgi:glycosyltransferase 2 family protein